MERESDIDTPIYPIQRSKAEQKALDRTLHYFIKWRRVSRRLQKKKNMRPFFRKICIDALKLGEDSYMNKRIRILIRKNS